MQRRSTAGGSPRKCVEDRSAAARSLARKFKLLAALANNLGDAITRERLLELVWDEPAKLNGERTVDVHIQRIRRRLRDDAKDLIERRSTPSVTNSVRPR